MSTSTGATPCRLATRAAKEPAIRDGPSLGRKRHESRDDRKLRTSRPGRLWQFTHSAAATGDRGATQGKAPLGAEQGYVSGHDQRGEGPDPRNQPRGLGVTVTDWQLHTADPRHIDSSGNQTAE
jgi:hypothetical protein